MTAGLCAAVLVILESIRNGIQLRLSNLYETIENKILTYRNEQTQSKEAQRYTKK